MSCALAAAALLLTACPPPGGGGTAPTYTTTVTGTVTGIVPDRPTNVLLPGATVSASTTPATTTTTGPGGTFRLRVTHAGSFTLTVAKRCYGTAPARTITAGGSGHDAGVIALTPVPEPTGNDRFTLKQNPGTAANPTYTLTVNCVRTVTAGEFASSPSSVSAPSSIISNTRLAGQLGTNPTGRVTAIELPDTLRTIGRNAFHQHLKVTGEFTIPAAVESIGVGAFRFIGQSGQIRLRFARDSRLKTIENVAFTAARISAMTPLPQSLETVGLRAFEDAFTSAAGPSLSNFVIPENVRSVGNSAFGSTVFSGTLTIRSPHLTRTPTDRTQTRTGRLGSSIFTEGGTAAVTQEFTRIVMPRAVFTSYTQADLNAIFGPSSGVTYADLADGTTLDITTLTP